MVFLKNYLDKFKKIQSESDSSLTFFICLANAFGLAYVGSWIISYHTWIFLGKVESLNPLLFEFSIHFPTIYFGIICLTVLDKMTFGLLIVSQFYQKIILIAIQHFDVYWWRKTGRQSIISEKLWRFQNKLSKTSRSERNKIFLFFGSLLFLWYCFRLEII